MVTEILTSEIEIETIQDTHFSVLRDLREIKKLVGALEASEDTLEQVWRLADSIQIRLGVFEDLFERIGIYADCKDDRKEVQDRES